MRIRDRRSGAALTLALAVLACSRPAAGQSLGDIFDSVKKGAEAAQAVDQLTGQPKAPANGAEAQQQPGVNPLTKREVAELVAEGVAPAIVVAALQKRKCAFSVDASEIVALKKRGFDDSVIKAMIDNAVSENLAAMSHSARVNFVAPENSSDTWTLRRSDGSLVCTLPCASNVSTGAGMYVQKDASDPDDILKLKLPTQFAHGSDKDLEMEVREPAGSPALGGILLGLGLSGLLIGGIFWGVSTATEKDAPPSLGGVQPPEKENTLKDVGKYLTLGGAVLTVPGIIVVAASREGGLRERTASASSAAHRRASVRSAFTPATLMIGPGFVSGTF